MPAGYSKLETSLAGTKRDDGSWVGTPYFVTVGGSTRSWTGSQSRRKPHPLTDTNCSSTVTVWTDPIVARRVGKDVNTYLNASSREFTKLVTSRDDPSGAARAQGMAYARLAKGDMSLLTTLIEGRETVSWVTHRIMTLVQSLTLMRKGRFAEALALLGASLSQRAERRIERARRGAKRGKDILSNTWLEWQFAVKPLVNDVHGAVEAYQKKIQVGDRVSRTGDWNWGTSGGDTQYRHTISARVSNPTVRTLQQLGIFNISAAAWDVIPLSFVIDWFVNIGQVLTMGHEMGLSDVTHCEIKISTVDIVGRDSGKVFRHAVTYGRSVVSSPKFPSFLVNPNLNSGKLITALSLLHRKIR